MYLEVSFAVFNPYPPYQTFEHFRTFGLYYHDAFTSSKDQIPEYND